MGGDCFSHDDDDDDDNDIKNIQHVCVVSLQMC